MEKIRNNRANALYLTLYQKWRERVKRLTKRLAFVLRLSNKYEKRWLSLSKPLYLVLMVISTSSMTIFTELFGQPRSLGFDKPFLRLGAIFVGRTVYNAFTLQIFIDSMQRLRLQYQPCLHSMICQRPTFVFRRAW